MAWHKFDCGGVVFFMGDLGMTYTSDKWATERIADLEEAGIAITSKYDEAKARIAELEAEVSRLNDRVLIEKADKELYFKNSVELEAKLAALEHQEPEAWIGTHDVLKGGKVRKLFWQKGQAPTDWVQEWQPLYTSAPPAVPGDVVKDAERHRWMRDAGATFYVGDKRYHVCESAMDDAIDSAIAAEKEATK